MNRQAMIERLVEDDIQVIKDEMPKNNFWYLNFILRDGVGYNKMSDESLIEEFNNRSWEIEE